MKIHLTDCDRDLETSTYVQVLHLHIPIPFSPFMGKNVTRKNQIHALKFTVVLYK